MSAAEHVLDSDRDDSRRLLIAILAAVALHVCLFIVFAIVRLTEHPLDLTTVSVDVVPGTLGGVGLAQAAAQAGPSAPAQAGGPSAPRSATGRASAGQGFTIPTPRQGAETSQLPSGPAFREAGPRTAAPPSSAERATTPVQEPVFAPSRSASQQGAAAATRGGGGAPSRGVLVQGGGQAAATGSLNLGGIDQAAAQGRQNGGGQGGTAEGSGAQGSGAAGAGGGQGDYRFRWDQPEAGKIRKLLSSPQPRVPAWVSKQGLTLTVLIAFTLTPDGVLSDVNVEASSGWNEVDAAVTEAVRLWRFNADPGARSLHGLIPYVIRAR